MAHAQNQAHRNTTSSCSEAFLGACCHPSNEDRVGMSPGEALRKLQPPIASLIRLRTTAERQQGARQKKHRNRTSPFTRVSAPTHQKKPKPKPEAMIPEAYAANPQIHHKAPLRGGPSKDRADVARGRGALLSALLCFCSSFAHRSKGRGKKGER